MFPVFVERASGQPRGLCFGASCGLPSVISSAAPSGASPPPVTSFTSVFFYPILLHGACPCLASHMLPTTVFGTQ